MIASLVLSCLALAAQEDPLAAVPLVKTKHYRLLLDMDSDRLADWKRLTEVAWTAYFKELELKPKTKRGKQPIVRFYKTREQWVLGMEREQVFPLPGVNFVHYSPKRDTIFMYDEVNRYHGRKMLLYGLFLQFHYKVKSKNQYLGNEWFITGMADALSTHRWDGEQLELGARLMLGTDNRSYLALQRGLLEKIQDGQLSVEDMSDWDVRWALTAFLMFGKDREYNEVFQKLALGKTGSMLQGHDFLAGIGDVAVITAEMDDWVRTRSRVIHPIEGIWTEFGGEIYGQPGVGGDYAIALTDPEPQGLEVEVEAMLSSELGLVLDWNNSKLFTVAILQDGVLRVIAEDGRGAQELDVIDIPGARRGQVRLGIVRDEQEVVLMHGAIELRRYDATGKRLGLAVRTGRGTFNQVLPK